MATVLTESAYKTLLAVDRILTTTGIRHHYDIFQDRRKNVPGELSHLKKHALQVRHIANVSLVNVSCIQCQRLIPRLSPGCDFTLTQTKTGRSVDESLIEPIGRNFLVDQGVCIIHDGRNASIELDIIGLHMLGKWKDEIPLCLKMDSKVSLLSLKIALPVEEKRKAIYDWSLSPSWF